MSLWSRIAKVFRGRRLSRQIIEELASPMGEEGKRGCDPTVARRAVGLELERGEGMRDVRFAPWFDSLRADIVFGWRQLRKNLASSGAAILSLALAIGACTSAFRLIDALLLRPLPIPEPHRLYILAHRGIDPSGRFRTSDS